MRSTDTFTCLAAVVTLVSTPALASPDGASRITTLTAVSDVSWSPDGSELAFGYDGDVWVVDDAGASAIRLSDDTELDYGPQWSPVDDRIVFFRDADLWTVDRVSGVETPILATAADEQYPTWAPFGDRIAYSRRDGGTWELWIKNLSNGANFPLVQLAGLDVMHPDWSPTAQYITFEVRPPGGEADIGIFDIGANEVLQLINLPTHDGRPSWSPSGAYLIFESERDAVSATDSDIYRMPMYGASGGIAEPISCSDSFDANPVWSPGGDRIAFLSQRDLVGGQFDIYLLGPDVVAIDDAHGIPSPGGLTASPNPFRSGTSISIALGSAPVKLRVFDLAGRMVRRLTSAGGGVYWDGRDESGRRVSPGVYHVLGDAGRARIVHLR